MAVARRIGIMGGTFDPIHLGHLVTAEQARADLGLDEVVFVPAGQPWQKDETTPPEHRYLMTVLATAANPAFMISRLEIERQGPTYTVDTLRAMRAACPDDELFFITGADAIVNILTWKAADECLALAEFVAATRPGHDVATLHAQGLADRLIFLDVPALAISSTDVRERFRAGRSVRYLIPREVEEYARKHGLYGTLGHHVALGGLPGRALPRAAPPRPGAEGAAGGRGRYDRR
ncbi:MAG TPA: nicotinate-nucleotide adenylyltransferase [Egibacteraceae bacterium]|jgi:nicotinate-nucleotide adenylyltransferase|nr:nicotinate-nucleotide adenylyltransferase [Egibacteraceae bacterium]